MLGLLYTAFTNNCNVRDFKRGSTTASCVPSLARLNNAFGIAAFFLAALTHLRVGWIELAALLRPIARSTGSRSGFDVLDY